MATAEDLSAIRTINARLFWSLGLLIPVLIAISLQPWSERQDPPMLFIVFGLGALGAFVSMQRQLNSLSSEYLAYFSSSWLNTLLIPMVGGVLASVLYCLFLSGLLSGDLFPRFCEVAIKQHSEGTIKKSMFLLLLDCQGNGPADYAKLFFWSFVAGFSEKFVIDIIGQFTRRDKS
jgi:hypothetical protein